MVTIKTVMEAVEHREIQSELSRISLSREAGAFALEVRELCRSLISDGYSSDAILEELEAFRKTLQEREDEAREDALLDVMDQLSGWCSPHARL